MKSIKTNLKALETMLFIWASFRDREKVSDIMFLELANSEEMLGAYDEEFSVDSVRKVLSAIGNRELLNSPSKKESRFWNYNMWMLEDESVTNMMLAPIKTLNLDDLKDEFSSINYDEVEVVFFPGHMDLYKIDKNKLYINFFLLKADVYGDGSVTIEDKSIKEFIKEKLAEIK
ncbi:MAG: hypothetical protein CSB15_00545 [Clostridiales bacterium]|nr:MAG: hypothetical protein CSB15_00545 [Clostridiales bacterium]